MLIVDAHEDLAWNMLTFGRDYMRSVAASRRLEVGSAAVKENGESCIGYPEWVTGEVAIVFATLFAAPERAQLSGTALEASYANSEQAHQIYQQQLRLYHEWVAAHPDKLVLVQQASDLDDVLATWQGDTPRKVGLVVLMEGADGVRTPDEVGTWYQQGVRLVGPAWHGTQYVGGTTEPGGFTESGKVLLREMAQQGLVLDISHLSDEAVPEAFDLFSGLIVASHCNARALLPSARNPERHLTDAAIRGVAERNGVIGIVLGNFFIWDNFRNASARANITLEHVADHIDHMAQLVGHTRHIGIGSDFDGGFGLEYIPTGLDSVADLGRIGDTLSRRGYEDAEIAGILGENWLRVLRAALR